MGLKGLKVAPKSHAAGAWRMVYTLYLAPYFTLY
ncbi:hypothetical protein X564_11170 [Pseudoalteromonas agarivorans]|nr:hypothetical protein X564_11170 [Pseudoalteromonas agarivorans]